MNKHKEQLEYFKSFYEIKDYVELYHAGQSLTTEELIEELKNAINFAEDLYVELYSTEIFYCEATANAFCKGLSIGNIKFTLTKGDYCWEVKYI